MTHAAGVTIRCPGPALDRSLVGLSWSMRPADDLFSLSPYSLASRPHTQFASGREDGCILTDPLSPRRLVRPSQAGLLDDGFFDDLFPSLSLSHDTYATSSRSSHHVKRRPTVCRLEHQTGSTIIGDVSREMHEDHQERAVYGTCQSNDRRTVQYAHWLLTLDGLSGWFLGPKAQQHSSTPNEAAFTQAVPCGCCLCLYQLGSRSPTVYPAGEKLLTI